MASEETEPLTRGNNDNDLARDTYSEELTQMEKLHERIKELELEVLNQHSLMMLKDEEMAKMQQQENDLYEMLNEVEMKNKELEQQIDGQEKPMMLKDVSAPTYLHDAVAKLECEKEQMLREMESMNQYIAKKDLALEEANMNQAKQGSCKGCDNLRKSVHALVVDAQAYLKLHDKKQTTDDEEDTDGEKEEEEEEEKEEEEEEGGETEQDGGSEIGAGSNNSEEDVYAVVQSQVSYTVGRGGQVVVPMPPENGDKNELETKLFIEATNLVVSNDMAGLQELVDANEKISVLNLKDTTKNNNWCLLHVAAYLNVGGPIEFLAVSAPELLTEQDVDGDSPLHIACYWDNVAAMKSLILGAKMADLDGPPDANHLRQIVNLKNNKGESPIFNAAIRASNSALKLIMVSMSPLGLIRDPNSQLQQVGGDHFCFLQKAPYHRKMANVDLLIDFHSTNKEECSVSNILIGKTPDTMLKIMDKCVSEEKLKIQSETTGDFHKVIVDFAPLENFTKPCDRPDVNRGGNAMSQTYKYSQKPLDTIAKKQKKLLTHPLPELLIMTKWHQYGAPYFWFITLPFYLLFICSLLAYQFLQVRPYVPSEDPDGETVIVASYLASTCEPGSSGCFYSKPSLIPGYIVLVMATVRLLFEIMDLIYEVRYTRSTKERSALSRSFHGLLSYLGSVNNLVELVLYSTAIAFSSNVLTGDLLTPGEWQVGVVCVSASFINLFLLMRVIPKVGLYTIMFVQICQTFVTRIFLLLAFFLFFFVIIFNMTSDHISTFSSVWAGRPYLRQLARGVSGIDYGDLDDEGGKFEGTVMIAMVFFAILVQVLFINLATGLAIEDVKQIMDDAQAERNAVKVTHIHLAEKILGHKMLKQLRTRLGLAERMELRRFQAYSAKDVPNRVLMEIRRIYSADEAAEE